MFNQEYKTSDKAFSLITMNITRSKGIKYT